MGLDEDGCALGYFLQDKLMQFAREEEEYSRQRGSFNWILKGDPNTTYFHAIANRRLRKCAIPNLVMTMGTPTRRTLDTHLPVLLGFMGFEGEARIFSLGRDLCLWEGMCRMRIMITWGITFSPAELEEVLANMKEDSVSGPDGASDCFL
jgi:hypothetical protein